jgi:hypothetical protein
VYGFLLLPLLKDEEHCARDEQKANDVVPHFKSSRAELFSPDFLTSPE